MLGRESKWCSAGDEIADRASSKDDMTSVDAGLTITWFDVRLLTSRFEVGGREGLCRARLDSGPKTVLANVLCGIAGLRGGSNMAKRWAE